jgi:uncharacterized protein YqgC (DUF456 family)
MIYLAAGLLVIVNTVWLVLTLLTLPGNWLMVASAAAVAWWGRDAGMISLPVLIVAGALAAGGEVVEFTASAVAVRKTGASRWGAMGSLLGAIVGLIVGTVAIPLPIVGSLTGACAGAVVGALLLEIATGRKVKRALRPSLAAGAGRLAGTLIKFAIGVVIWMMIAVAAFWG